MIRTAIESGEKLIFYGGGSMWPTFRPGDRLFIEDCGASALLPGEVVVFRCGKGAANARVSSGGANGDGQHIVHRVLGVSERDGRTWVRTQGDCSLKPDPEWPADRLVGRVVEVSPVKGRPRKLAPRPFLGWRLRHRLSWRRIARALSRRAELIRRRLGLAH